jgi:hypothetical protein
MKHIAEGSLCPHLEIFVWVVVVSDEIAELLASWVRK